MHTATKRLFVFKSHEEAAYFWAGITGEQRITPFVREKKIYSPDILSRRILKKRLRDYPFNILRQNLAVTYSHGANRKLIPWLMYFTDCHRISVYFNTKNNSGCVEVICLHEGECSRVGKIPNLPTCDTYSDLPLLD